MEKTNSANEAAASTERLVIAVECRHDDCTDIDTEYVSDSPPGTTGAVAVLDAAHDRAEHHAEEAGHRTAVSPVVEET